VAVYALSRGNGMPDATRAALQRARGVLEEARQRGAVRRIDEQRIGLEGETRLCAEIAEQSVANALLDDLEHATGGVDLINLAAEPCADRTTAS
jgi:hypothetical protein